MNHTLKYGKKEISVEIKRTKRKKTVMLQVILPTKVVVLSPSFLREAEIDVIVRQRMPWALKKIEELEKAGYISNYQREFVSGESFPYLGRQYRLKVVQDDGGDIDTCRLANGNFM